MHRIYSRWFILGGAAVVLILASVYLVTLTWPVPTHVVQASARGLHLSEIKQRAFHQSWACEETWHFDDIACGNRWAFPSRDGGIAYLDDHANAFFVGPEGSKLNKPGSVAAELAGCFSCISDGRGGYFGSTDGYRTAGHALFHIDRIGNLLWTAKLAGYIPVMKSGDDGVVAVNRSETISLSAKGKVLRRTPLPSDLHCILSARAGHNGNVYVQGESAGDRPLLAVLRANGQRILQHELPCSTFRVLPDGSLLLAYKGLGLERLSPSGKVLWQIRSGEASFDGENWLVSSDNMLLVWIGTQLHKFDLNGKEAGPPIELGVISHDYFVGAIDLLSAANGDVIVQIEIQDASTAYPLRNTILVLDPSGTPLLRLELGHDCFDLIAGGFHGEIFGIRWVAADGADKLGLRAKCEVVSLTPEL